MRATDEHMCARRVTCVGACVGWRMGRHDFLEALRRRCAGSGSRRPTVVRADLRAAPDVRASRVRGRACLSRSCVRRLTCVRGCGWRVVRILLRVIRKSAPQPGCWPRDWPPRRCLSGGASGSSRPVGRLSRPAVQKGPGLGSGVAREVLTCGRAACMRAALEPECGRRACVLQGARVLTRVRTCRRCALASVRRARASGGEREKNLIFRRLTSRTKSGRWASDMFAPAPAPSRPALEAPRRCVTRPVQRQASDGMADQITGRVRLCAHGPPRRPARARSDARAGLVVAREQFEWQPDSKRPRAGLSEATTDMSSLQVGAATSLVAVALRGVRAQGCWSFSSPPYGGELTAPEAVRAHSETAQRNRLASTPEPWLQAFTRLGKHGN